MQKVSVVKSDALPGKFRIITNVDDSFSVGTVVDRRELLKLAYDIKDIIEADINIIEKDVDAPVSE